MRRVAQQRHPPARPCGERLAVIERPLEKTLFGRFADQARQAVVPSLEFLQELVPRGGTGPAFDGPVACLDDADAVQQAPLPHRVAVEERAGADVGARRMAGQQMRHPLHRDQAAIGDLPAELRLRRVEQDAADRRPRPVRPDQDRPRQFAPVGQRHRHAIVRLDDPRHARVQRDRPRIEIADRTDQQRVEIGPVDAVIPAHPVLVRDLSDARDLSDHLAGAIVKDVGLARHVRDLAQPVAQAQEIDRPRRARLDGQAGTDLAQGGGLFQDLHREPRTQQRQRGAETADTGTGDEDGLVGHGRHSLVRRGGSWGLIVEK